MSINNNDSKEINRIFDIFKEEGQLEEKDRENFMKYIQKLNRPGNISITKEATSAEAAMIADWT